MRDKIKDTIRQMIMDGEITLTVDNVNDWMYSPSYELNIAIEDKEGDYQKGHSGVSCQEIIQLGVSS